MDGVVFTEQEQILRLEAKLAKMQSVVDAARALPFDPSDEYAWLKAALVALDR